VTTVNGVPSFKGDFAENVSDSDLTILALTLVLAEAEKNGDSFETYINSWTTDQKKINGTGLDTSSSEAVIAAAVNELAKPSRDNALAGMLKDLLGESESN
jgi:hypothetical protein